MLDERKTMKLNQTLLDSVKAIHSDSDAGLSSFSLYQP